MQRTHCPNFLTDRSLLEEKLSVIKLEDNHVIIHAVDEYCKALDTYLELPSLLDPIIPNHIKTLSHLIQSRLSTTLPNDVNTPLISVPSRALYTLIKVRGPKRITAYFPHQVHHLRALLPLLSEVESTPQSQRLWHLRYVLYIWLSVAIRVPFPLDTILTPQTLAQSLSHARNALLHPGPVAQAVIAFLSRLLSRRDTAHHRIAIVDHVVTYDLIPTAEASTRTTALALLASVFKHAHRDDLKPHVHRVLQMLSHPSSASTTTEAHFITKLSHRLALSFLPPRPAAWRYTRTLPTIRRVTGHTGPVEPGTYASLTATEADTLETVVDLLLTGLRQRDTVVRWSAAKGIARITARLPLQLAMDVTEAVLATFHDVQEARSDAAWHGACLALAELARRGLLLPSDKHFHSAFSAVKLAAAFDVRRGANSVGAHVRDAACYAIWAVARAYEKEDVAAFAPIITEALLPLALLDREVNCRRAAAAALQECVGRLSPDLFVDGIKLITLVDYFSLGDRNAAYLIIAPQVARIGGGIHFDIIVQELWNRKLVHWDLTIRALASKALAELVSLDNDRIIVRDILPELVSMATQRGDMVYRHGAVLGISELVRVVGFGGLRSLATEIRCIPSLLQEKKLLTGRTGDDIRIACCQLIQSLATWADDLFLGVDCARTAAEDALNYLETILACGKEDLYSPATSAYRAVCDSVIATDKQWHIEVTQRILDGITASTSFEHQRGFALAAGACGDSVISPEVVAILCKESIINKDVEVRRNCMSSLGIVPLRVLKERLTEVLHGLALGMEDYATDDRGDVGSWVREASMRSVSKVLSSVHSENVVCASISFDLNSEAGVVLLVLNKIIEQCCSKIDRTRGVAGEVLKEICVMFCAKRMPKVSRVCEMLSDIFGFAQLEKGSENPSAVVTFVESADAFPAMRKILYIPEISKSVIRGFVSASGGMGQQASHARDSLACHFREKKHLSLSESELGEIMRIIDNREERLLIPALKTLDSLLKRCVLRKLRELDLQSLILTVKKSWRQRLRDVKLVTAAIGVLSEIASLSGSTYSFQFDVGSPGRDCLEALVVVLGGPLPRLRRIAAENLYMILLEVDADLESGFNQVEKCVVAMDILIDTRWEQMDVLKARRRRNEFCRALGIRIPVVVKPMVGT